MPYPEYPQNPTRILDEHTEKGCIHWFNFYSSNNSINSQKVRPYIIIGRNNYKSRRIIISPLSDLKHYLELGTSKLKYPYHAPIYKSKYKFLEKDSVVLLDQVYTVSKEELCEEWYIGKIDDCSGIDKAIIYNYDLFESIYQAYAELLKQFAKDYERRFARK